MRKTVLGLLFGGLSVFGEKHEFQAEVSRLMDIIIHSLYTHKEVFLRELISNSADALEKARYMSLSDEAYLGDAPDLELKVWFDEEARTLSLEDSGIGMTKDELIANLGTVAKSGTANFLEQIAGSSSSSDKSLIGQFGVGFYSAYLVADRVEVHSKAVSSTKQWMWESTASSSFTVNEDSVSEEDRIARGTRIVLHLKEDASEYLSEARLKELITKYSQFITFPIKLRLTKERTVARDEEATVVEDEEAEKKKEKYFEWEVLNEAKPIWLRSKEEISDQEYQDFYKQVIGGGGSSMGQVHFSGEGEVEFKALLYIPEKAPYDMMDNYWTKKSEVKLYVRRVLVADKFEDLLPRYLNFVKGVIDSDHLPLNVSREQLQQNAIMKVIGKKLVRKILDLIKTLNETQSATFLKEFGKQLKMGCYEDDGNRSRIAKLLRFQSMLHKDEKDAGSLSLDDYIAKAATQSGDANESIYYMSGEDIGVMEKLPVLEMFKKKQVDVLLLTDSLDEPCLQRLGQYEGKKFVSIQKTDVKLPETEDEKKQFGRVKKLYKPLTDWWKKTLPSGTVDKVVISKRLVEAPCVVVSSQYGYSAQQEKIMKAQAFNNKDTFNMMVGKKTLEINPYHPVILDLLNKVKADLSDKLAAAKDTATVLYEAALLESGYEIADASGLVKKIYKLMSTELGVDPEAPLVQQLPDLPEEEEEAKKEEETSTGDFDFGDLGDLDLEDEDDHVRDEL